MQLGRTIRLEIALKNKRGRGGIGDPSLKAAEGYWEPIGMMLRCTGAVALVATLLLPTDVLAFRVPEANFMMDINGISLGVEKDHVCVIEEKLGEEIGGKVNCYGHMDESGRMDPPEDGLFVQVVTGHQYGCGINLDQTLSCWGRMHTPEGLFTQITGGDSYMCGVMVDNTIKCAGNLPFEANQIPQNLKFVQVSCGGGHCCTLDNMAVPHCWGPSTDPKVCGYILPPTEKSQNAATSETKAAATAPGDGEDEEEEDFDMYEDEDENEGASQSSGLRNKIQMRQVTASNEWSCGISLEGQNLHCWGHKRIHSKRPDSYPPKFLLGPFKQVSAGAMGVCALRESKEKGGDSAAVPADGLQCWGTVDFLLPNDLRKGAYDQIEVGPLLSCVVTMVSELACWGPSKGNVDLLEIPDTLVIA